MWRWLLARLNAQLDVLITFVLTWAVLHGGQEARIALIAAGTATGMAALVEYKKMLLQS